MVERAIKKLEEMISYATWNINTTADTKKKLIKMAMEEPENFNEEYNVILTTPDSMISEDLR